MILLSNYRINKIRYYLVEKRVLDDLANKNHQGIVLDIYDYEYKDIDEMVDNLIAADNAEKLKGEEE